MMIEAVQAWVAEADQIPAASVTVHANDRRLRVPECSEGFTIARPFPDPDTLRVACAEASWQIVLSIDTRQAEQAWVFTSALPGGHQLDAADLRLTGESAEELASHTDTIGKVLKVPVRQGQRLSQNALDDGLLVYRLIRDVAADQALQSSDLRPEYVAASTLPEPARVSLEEIGDARAGRDLQAGVLLRRHDLKFRQSVLVATELIERGAALTAQNTQRNDVWASLPVDIFPYQAELPRVVATGRISPGQTIRHSQVRLLPEIVTGESVATQVRRGNLEISVQLEAMEDGRAGQQIRLRNPQSGRVITAIVVDNRRAKIQ